MQDLVNVGDVDVTVDDTGKLWVNVDGKCVLRVGHAKRVQMDHPLRGIDVVWDEDEATTPVGEE